MSYLRSLDPVLLQPRYHVRGEVFVGRDPAECRVVVAREYVGRRHCRFFRDDAGCMIEDLNSRNGTYIDGARIQGVTVLRGGQKISLGRPDEAHFEFSENNPGGTRRFLLRSKKEYTIGRQDDNDIPLPLHPAVSGRHARLKLSGRDRLFLRDMGSTNGTYVDGQLISEIELSPESVVTIGAVDFVFSLDGSGLTVHMTDRRNQVDLNAEEIVVRVGDKTLLHKLSFIVKPGEYVGLLGPSGAGKSTLLKALCGVQPAVSGRVLLNGSDLYHSFDLFRDTLGYVPQDDIIHTELSVERSLDYTARLRLPRDKSHENLRNQVNSVIETLSLPHVRGSRVASLSGGQRKRVSIGNELLTRPSLLFLDEPTSGLDPGTEEKLMRHFREMSDDGQSVLVTTHVLYNIDLFDLIAILACGRLVYYGPPADALNFFDRPEYRITAHTHIYGMLDLDGHGSQEERENMAETWESRYRGSQLYQDFVGGDAGHARISGGERPFDGAATGARLPVARPKADATTEPRRPRMKKKRRTPVLTQFAVLVSRLFDLRLSKLRNLLIPLLAPFVLALLTSSIKIKPEAASVADRDKFIKSVQGLQLPATGPFSIASHLENLGTLNIPLTLPLAIAMVAAFLGTFAACSEIAPERAVYMRERAVNLHIPVYLASKLPYLFLLTFVQCFLFILTLCLFNSDLIRMADIPILILAATATAWSSTALGLLLSSADPSSGSLAMILAVILVLPQMFLCGAMGPDFFGGMPKPFQWFASALPARWGFEMMLTTLYQSPVWARDLIQGRENCLIPEAKQGLVMGFEFGTGMLWRNAGVLAGLGGIYLGLASLSLKRQDAL